MRPAFTVTAGLAAGLVLGLLLGRGPLGPADDGAPIEVVLERELADERDETRALREQVEVLEERLARAEAASAEAAAMAMPIEGEPEPTDVASVSEEGEEGDAAEEEVRSGGGFSEERLLALGFHERDVERLKRAWESLELERLYLQNERARSSRRDGRFWLRMRELEKATLEELGESDYDALLFAAGNRNRVTVTRVFPESPAESAGFDEGDEIVAYDGRPIFRMQVLKGETTRCAEGTNVAVTVLRDGAERRLWTPCGPLGVQLEMVNAPPR